MLTPSAFLAFYPQFSSFSQGVVLPEYLRQANARFSDFGEDAEEARRLYTAHKLTLYAASSPPEGAAGCFRNLPQTAPEMKEVPEILPGRVRAARLRVYPVVRL